MKRRIFLAGLSATVLPHSGHAVSTRIVSPKGGDHNVSSFRRVTWEDHFDDLGKGTIIADTQSAVLYFWSADGEISKLFPCSVPQSEARTKRGYTKIVRKKTGPTWRPTPRMRRADPTLPAVVGPGPDNPLGTHALYLGWTYYAIHGTHNDDKIGRRSSSGCIGLYNHHIAELFELAQIGTQVKII